MGKGVHRPLNKPFLHELRIVYYAMQFGIVQVLLYNSTVIGYENTDYKNISVI